jgi:bloom syndrome protein
LYTLHVCINRGDSFRIAYAHLEEIRSYLSADVNIIALTATATKSTFDTICSRLSLHNPLVVGCAPARPNISYVVKPLPSIDKFAGKLSTEVRLKGLSYPKTVIFC